MEKIIIMYGHSFKKQTDDFMMKISRTEHNIKNANRNSIKIQLLVKKLLLSYAYKKHENNIFFMSENMNIAISN